MAFEVNNVQLSSNLRLQYVEQGWPGGTPVVLLHGVTDSWRSFEPLLPYLPTSLHVFALTQRGHGDSDRPEDGYTFDQMAEDVAQFMDAIGLRSAVVAGHSMGASVAQRFAISHPDRVRALVLLASFASMRDNPGVHEYTASVIAPLGDIVPVDVAREFQETTLARPIPPAMLDVFVQESLKVPARIWKVTFEGFLESDLSKDYNKIKAPTLILWGDQDVFCLRSDQDTLLSGIGDARIIVYPGVGHAVHWEQPERVAKDIVHFING